MLAVVAAAALIQEGHTGQGSDLASLEAIQFWQFSNKQGSHNLPYAGTLRSNSA